MSMTRKHFRALADALKSAHPAENPKDLRDCDESRAAWRAAVVAVAEVCHRENPMFQTTKFFEACTAD